MGMRFFVGKTNLTNLKLNIIILYKYKYNTNAYTKLITRIPIGFIKDNYSG